MKDERVMGARGLDEWLQHAGWLSRLARGLVHDEGEAEDVVQETWIAALGAGEVARPRAWLAGTLRRVVLARGRAEARRRGREERAARGEAVASGVESLEVVERQERLLALVRALPAAQRDVLVARYYEGLAPREIASRHGVALETVKSRLKRGLATLRAELDSQHGERSAWAAWLVPLLQRDAHAAGTGFGALIGGAVLAVAAVGVALVLMLREPRGPAASEPAASVLVAAVPAPAARSQALAPATQDSARAPVASAATRVVVRAPDGGPAAGARVVVLDRATAASADPSTIARFQADVERMVAELGRTFTAGADGTASVELVRPFLVWASSDAGAALLEVVAPADEVVVPLRAVQPLVVQVLDARGRPLAGVPVAAEVYMRAADDARAGDDERWSFVRETTEAGARFQDPLGLWSRAPESERRGYWTHVRVHVPGAPEASGEAGVRLDVDPTEGALGEELAPRLVMPPTGSLALELDGSSEERARLDGEVVLRVRGPGGRPGQDAFPAELVDGVARWPLVALGRHLALEVSVPGLGARWELDGAGPTVAGEERVLRSARPELPGLTGVLRDAGGRALAGREVHVHFPETRGAASVLARTDDDGRVRLEWPAGDDPVERVLFLLPDRASPERQALAELALAPGTRRDHDFGALVLVPDPRGALAGAVTDDTGAPVRGAMVTAVQATGVNFGDRTDDAGRFSIPGPFPARVAVTVQPLEDGLARTAFTVEHPGPDGAVALTLAHGATVHGSLVLPGCVEPWRVRVLLFREDGDGFRQAEVEPDGAFAARGLVPGRWRLELRLAGNATLYRVDGVDVRGGDVRDARLEGIDVGALVREIRVERTDGGRPDLVELVVDGPDEQLDRPRFGQARLVPRTGEWSARFSARGRRSVLFEDATRLPDVVTLDFEQPLTVVLRPAGAFPSGVDLELRGEPGGPAHGALVPLPPVPVGEPWRVELPAPGTYRLARVARHETGGGPALLTVEETTALVEVLDVPGQELVLDPSAPARRQVRNQVNFHTPRQDAAAMPALDCGV